MAVKNRNIQKILDKKMLTKYNGLLTLKENYQTRILNNKDFKFFALKYSDVFEREKEREKEINKLFQLSYHFSYEEYSDLIADENRSIKDNIPWVIYQYLTPFLLHFLPTEWFLKDFGFCIFCTHFQGHNKIHYKQFLTKNQNIVPYMGKCVADFIKIEKERRKENTNQPDLNNHVSSCFRCALWYPNNFYFMLFENRLMKLLNFLEKTYGYTKEIYLEEVCHRGEFWEYYGVYDD